ncbi:1,4-alpha-glucan branching enzyme, partial [Kitasatospora paranensis]
MTVLQTAPIPLPEARPAPDDTARLLSGRHHDPHAVLGAHPVGDGTAVRVLRPGAVGVDLLTAGGAVPLTGGPDGLFTVLLPAVGPPGYRLRVRYPGGVETVQEDGYRVAPTLGELDLHL